MCKGSDFVTIGKTFRENISHLADIPLFTRPAPLATGLGVRGTSSRKWRISDALLVGGLVSFSHA